MKYGWKALLPVLVLLIALAAADPAWGHRMLVREEEPGVLRAFYEGGVLSPSSVITLYDAHGAVILEGQVDAQGFFRYDRARFPAVRAAADDGMGHRAVIDLDAPPPAAEIPAAVRTVFGLSVLLFIVAFFRYWSRRRERAPAPDD